MVLVGKIRGIKELAKYVNKEFNPSLINNMNDEEAIHAFGIKTN